MQKVCSLLFILFLVVAIPASVHAETAQLKAPAPSFSITDASGKKVSLADYKGKTVVLEWLNPQCPYVVRHYKEGTMKQLSKKYAEKDVVWLSINSTHFMTADENKAWKEQQGLNWPLLVDREGDLGKLYSAKTTPHMFIIDSKGQLAYRGAIDDDALGEKPSSERINYVANALDELVSGKEVSVSETKSYGCSVKYKG